MIVDKVSHATYSLINLYDNNLITSAFYDICDKHLTILEKAAKDLGFLSLIDLLEKEASNFTFCDKTMFICPEDIMTSQENSILAISEDLMLFFFHKTSDVRTYDIEIKQEKYILQPIPDYKVQEIFTSVDPVVRNVQLHTPPPLYSWSYAFD